MPPDPRDYKVDLSGAASDPEPAASPRREFLSVMFACCGVYQRIYKTADGRHYRGRCPKCGRAVQFVVGPDGTNCRTFIVQ